MAEITVPRYMIKQIAMPYGLRQGKKPVLKVPVEVRHTRGFNPMSHDRHINPNVHLFMPFDQKGVFESWEYRFWMMGLINNEPVCQCRSCGALGGDRTTRKQHHEKGKCTTKLTAAYNLLRRDKICVICDVRTTRGKWGVPICSNGCEEAWCEVEATPTPLLFALKLIPVEG